MSAPCTPLLSVTVCSNPFGVVFVSMSRISSSCRVTKCSSSPSGPSTCTSCAIRTADFMNFVVHGFTTTTSFGGGAFGSGAGA
jgi:hypothetical protein